MPITLWAPAGAKAQEPLGLLVVHDGPEYDRAAQLTHYAAAMIAAGALPAHRVALLAPREREESYSASAPYARTLVGAVLPALHDAVAVRGDPVGLGASLGALALLHAHRRYGPFGALLLQSGSFFTPRTDPQESGFARYGRIVRFVRAATAAGAMGVRPVPVALTCSRDEENLANNRKMACALAAQGYSAALHLHGGPHAFTAWRAALHPHLTDLLAAAWPR